MNGILRGTKTRENNKRDTFNRLCEWNLGDIDREHSPSGDKAEHASEFTKSIETFVSSEWWQGICSNYHWRVIMIMSIDTQFTSQKSY